MTEEAETTEAGTRQGPEAQEVVPDLTKGDPCSEEAVVRGGTRALAHHPTEARAPRTSLATETVAPEVPSELH